jgi:hypothetical protein
VGRGRAGLGALLLAITVLAAAGPAQEEPPEGPDDPQGLIPELEDRKRPREKPKLKMRAWLGTGDEYDYRAPRGFLVPIGVEIDNPEAAFTGELIATVFVGAEYRDPKTNRITVVDTEYLSRLPVVFEEAQPPRKFCLTVVVPVERTVQLYGAEVRLVRDGDDPVVQLQLGQAGVGFSLMVLGSGLPIFREEDEAIEERDELAEMEDDKGGQRWPGFPAGDSISADNRARLQTDFSIGYPDPDVLPTSATSWCGVWAVMVHSTGVTPERFERHLDAVIDHAMRGGIVVLVPGRELGSFASGPLGVLLPVASMEAIPEVAMPAELLDPQEEQRRRQLGQPQVTLAGVQAEVRPGAEVLVKSPEGVPLVVRGSYGLGAVYWFGYDPAKAPVRERSLVQLRSWTMGERRTRLRESLEELLQGDVSERAFKIHAPPRREIMGFLCVYLVLLVPLNYLIFSLLRRRELAWVAVPLLAGAFAYYYYHTGFLTKLRFLTTYGQGVVVMMPGLDEPGYTSRAYTRGQIWFYSPSNDRLSVSFENPEIGFGQDVDDTLRKFEGRLLAQEYRLESGRRTLQGVRIRARASRPMNVEGYLELPGAIVADLEVDRVSGRLSGTLANRLEGISLVGAEQRVSGSAAGTPTPVEPLERLELLITRAAAATRDGQRPRPEAYREFLSCTTLAPGDSVTLPRLDPAEYPGPDGLAGNLAIYLVGRIHTPLLHPLVNGEARESQGAEYVTYVRIW